MKTIIAIVMSLIMLVSFAGPASAHYFWQKGYCGTGQHVHWPKREIMVSERKIRGGKYRRAYWKQRAVSGTWVYQGTVVRICG